MGIRIVAVGQRIVDWADTAVRDYLGRSIASWRSDRREIVFVIGGPDGLAPEVKARANETMRLSAMTLPHALARVLLSEQLYRAWSILAGHPYHRA